MRIVFLRTFLETTCRFFGNHKYLGSQLKLRGTVTTFLIQVMGEDRYASVTYFARNTVVKSTPMI